MIMGFTKDDLIKCTTKYKREIFLFLLNLFIVILLLLFFSPHYETNDDLAMSKIASGMYLDENSTFLVFSNIIYGCFLRLFYILYGGCNWYVVIPLFIVFFANCLITLLVYKKTNIYMSIFVLALLYVLFGEYIFVRFQFTYMASYLSAVGLTILLYQLLCEKSSRTLSLFGIIISAFGFLIRKDAFIASAAIVSAFVLCYFIFNKVYKKEIKDILQWLLPFLMLGGVVIVSFSVNTLVYKSDSDWKYYLKYNKYRADLLDYGLPDYNTYKDDYKQIGIDALDYTMFKSWTYADQNKFSLETLEKMYELKQRIDPFVVNFASICNAIREIIQSFAKLYIIPASLVIMIWILFADKKKYWILVPFGVVVLELFYLYLKGRFIFRAYFGVWCMFFFAMMFLMIYYKMFELKTIKKMSTLICSLIIICIPNIDELWNNHYLVDEKIAEQKKNTSWIETLSKSKDNLYLIESTFDHRENSGYILNSPSQIYNNIYSLGGWRCPSPLNEYLLSKFGIDSGDVYSGLLNDNKNIYFVDRADMYDRVNKELEYIRKEYHSKANVELVEVLNDVGVYRFYVDTECDETNIKKSTEMIQILQGDLNQERILTLEGYALIPGEDTSKQNTWIQIVNVNTGVIKYVRATKMLNAYSETDYPNEHGISAGFTVNIDKTDLDAGNYEIYIVIENHGKVYSSADVFYSFSTY